MSRRAPTRRVRVRFRCDRGATAVEFALLVPFVLVLLAGLVFLGLRTVYAALAQDAAKEAVRTAALPPAGSAATGTEEVCQAAVAAVPAFFGPGAASCNGVPPSAAPGAGPTAVAVRVCPPDCTGFTHAVQCVALPAPLAAQGQRAPRQVALTPFFTRSPDPLPSPSPTVPSPPSSLGATVSPSPVPLPTLPSEVAVSASPPPVPLVSTTPLPGVGVTATPAVPRPLPTPAPTRSTRCTDERQGRLVAVSVTWRVGALEALSGLALGALSDRLATVEGTATGRRE